MAVLREHRSETPASTAHSGRNTLIRYCVPFVLCLGLAVIRTHGISQSFWLHGDQIRDWTIALGPWHDLPLSGTPSTVGGRAAGPIFYWTLWLIRSVIGPATDDLPHAGGIGLSIIQSLADGVLLLAIWSRFGSLVLALAIVLAGATSPFDMALSATIWNPPLAVSLVKLAMAAVLAAGTQPSCWRALGATVLAWLAVQAHSASIFVALPLMGAFVVRELTTKKWATAARTAGTIAVTVLILEIPFLLDLILHPSGPAIPTRVVEDLLKTIGDPGSLRLQAAAVGVGGAFQQFLLTPWASGWFFPLTLACAAAALWRVRRDLALASISVAPIACAVAGFAAWQGSFDSYWFLPLLPSFVLMVALGLTAIPGPRTTFAVGSVALVVVALVQPARFSSSRLLFRMEEYGALAQGSREVRRRMPAIRSLDVRFPLPPTTDPLFLYRNVLGGRVEPDAEYMAVIERSGRVEIRQVPAPDATTPNRFF